MAEQALSSKVVTAAVANVSFPVANNTDTCPAYLATEGRDSTMGVIVLQEWWGMNQAIQSTADDLARHGFRCLVPDLYRGKVAKDREQAGHLIGGLDWGKAVGDVAGAVQYLKSQGCKKVGVTGFCMGGALTVASCANIPDVAAGSVFYGKPDLTKVPVANTKAPMQLHFGRKDDAKGFSDPEAANALEKAMKDGKVDVTLFMYEEAGHAFMNRDRPDAYNEKAAKEAMGRTVEFFKKNLA